MKKIEEWADLNNWDTDCDSCGKPLLLFVETCRKSEEKVPPNEMLTLLVNLKSRKFILTTINMIDDGF